MEYFSIMSLVEQFKQNALAIIGLVVAIIALVNTTSRENTTEINRNMRAASFELLKNLGELQIVVNSSYYQEEGMKTNPFMGWGRVAFIRDMSELLPKPIPEKTVELIDAWKSNWDKLKSDEKAVLAVSAKIDADREAVLAILKKLK